MIRPAWLSRRSRPPRALARPPCFGRSVGISPVPLCFRWLVLVNTRHGIHAGSDQSFPILWKMVGVIMILHNLILSCPIATSHFTRKSYQMVSSEILWYNLKLNPCARPILQVRLNNGLTMSLDRERIIVLQIPDVKTILVKNSIRSRFRDL